MIHKNKYDLIPSQIETCENWTNVSKTVENPFARYCFNRLAYRSLAWIFCGQDDIGVVNTNWTGETPVRAFVEYAYLRNPKLMQELVDGKQFTAAREFAVKEAGEAFERLDPRASSIIETERELDALNRAFTFVQSKDYSPSDRVRALLETIECYDANLAHCNPKQIAGYEKGARVFGDFLNTFVSAICPILKNERRPTHGVTGSKRTA